MHANSIISDERQKHHFTYEFNPSNCSHMGGIFERQVKSVKQYLWKVIPTTTTLTVPELRYVLGQACQIINDTPLQQLEAGSDQYVTPSQLLLGRRLTSVPVEVNKTTSTMPLDVQSRFKMREAIVSQFWTIWEKQYRAQLTQRHKWFRPNPSLAVGDLVVVREKMKKRSNWPVLLVASVRKSADNRVRSVALRKGNKIIYPSLPLDRIYPLNDSYEAEEAAALHTKATLSSTPPAAKTPQPEESSSRTEEPVGTSSPQLANPTAVPPNLDLLEEPLDHPPHWNEIPVDEHETWWTSHWSCIIS